MYFQNYENVKACAYNATGNAWEHEVAVITDNLSPAHQYVPWVVINGQHNVKEENAVLNDMLSYVCDNYDGDKPSCCN